MTAVLSVLAAYAAVAVFFSALFSANRTDEDRRLDDEEQMDYLRQYNEKMRNKKQK